MSQHAPDGELHISIGGEADLATAPLLECELARAVVEGRGDVVVDLWDAVLIDSSNVCRLIDATRRLAHEGRRLIVLGDPERHLLLRMPLVQRSLALRPGALAAQRRSGTRLLRPSAPACR